MSKVTDYLCNGCGQSYAECECATSSRGRRTKFKEKREFSRESEKDHENTGGTYSTDYGWSGN
jgi:hypothetical protein